MLTLLHWVYLSDLEPSLTFYTMDPFQKHIHYVDQ